MSPPLVVDDLLGKTMKDVITGFQGVVTGSCRYITGCDQYLLQPVNKANKHDDKKSAEWFDENRLKVVKGKKRVVIKSTGDKTGPCEPAPRK